MLEALQAVIIAPFSSIRQSWTEPRKLLWNHSRQRGNFWTSFILGCSKPKLSSKPKEKSSPAKSLITEMKKETTKLNEKMIETIFLLWKSLFWSYCQKNMREQQNPLMHHWCISLEVTRRGQAFEKGAMLEFVLAGKELVRGLCTSENKALLAFPEKFPTVWEQESS